MPLTISIVSPFLKFIFNFESQLETSLAGFPFPSSLSIPDLTPLNEALSRMPRKTLWKSKGQISLLNRSVNLEKIHPGCKGRSPRYRTASNQPFVVHRLGVPKVPLRSDKRSQARSVASGDCPGAISLGLLMTAWTSFGRFSNCPQNKL